MGNVVYLTGAPAAGKSSLVAEVKSLRPDLKAFIYSEVLADHLRGASHPTMTEKGLREGASTVIQPEDISAVDAKLLRFLKENRDSADIIIDCHAVSKESYGFRVTPFSRSDFESLAPDSIVVLFASSEVIQSRIETDAQGRPQLTKFQSDSHTFLQFMVGVTYSMFVGCPMYCLDSDSERSALAGWIVEKCLSRT